MDVLDPQQDTRIRAALFSAAQQGRLGLVAAVTGIRGGEKELRKIMRSKEPLSIIDRATLAVLLGA